MSREWRVLGIDASPSATGICRPDGELETWKNALKRGEPTARRLVYINDQVRSLLHLDEDSACTTDCGGLIDLAVIEGYNYGLKKFGDVFGIGESAGVIKLALAWRAIPLVTVSPAARAKFATGKGNAPKATVLEQWSRITGVDFAGDDNKADAHVLREIGLHLLGTPTYDLAPAHLEALTLVRKNTWNAAVLNQLKGSAA
jgi:Holliday junction resolvasome RuvABC endonuclease subunit